jgi:hypothetical protein
MISGGPGRIWIVEQHMKYKVVFSIATLFTIGTAVLPGQIPGDALPELVIAAKTELFYNNGTAKLASIENITYLNDTSLHRTLISYGDGKAEEEHGIAYDAVSKHWYWVDKQTGIFWKERPADWTATRSDPCGTPGAYCEDGGTVLGYPVRKTRPQGGIIAYYSPDLKAVLKTELYPNSPTGPVQVFEAISITRVSVLDRKEALGLNKSEVRSAQEFLQTFFKGRDHGTVSAHHQRYMNSLLKAMAEEHERRKNQQ